jgi:hypothetical protein
MERERIHKGLVAKLLTDYSNVPAGTWATVNSAGIMRDGTWWFSVRWHHYKPIPNRFPREVSEYSIKLWEPDLALFEAVSAEEEQEAKSRKLEPPPVRPSLARLDGGQRGRKRSLVHPHQLSLFLPDDF